MPGRQRVSGLLAVDQGAIRHLGRVNRDRAQTRHDEGRRLATLRGAFGLWRPDAQHMALGFKW